MSIATSELYHEDDDGLLKRIGLDGEYYSTFEAADLFFDKTDQWMYWGLREGIFVDEKGKKISPKKVGSGSRRRYTLGIIQEIALASYRRGNISKPRLAAIIRRIITAQNGGTPEEIKAIQLPGTPEDDGGAAKGAPRPIPNFYLKFTRAEPGRYVLDKGPVHYVIAKDEVRDWIWRLTFKEDGHDTLQLGGFSSVRQANAEADHHYRDLTGEGLDSD
jgi:hypothetical protein